MARAGVALYRVGAVKRRKHRTWLLVDGGMADNPRHALYGARYSCLPVKGLGRAMTDSVSIAGPYCESGDVLIDDLPMPPIEEGELLAVPMSGAYQLSMASNYNGARRPAAVWLETGPQPADPATGDERGSRSASTLHPVIYPSNSSAAADLRSGDD